ncbi:MAG: hypothetical protein ACPL4H_07105 [Anaerolineales bacterium]
MDHLIAEVARESALNATYREIQAEHHRILYGGNGSAGLKLDVADLQHSRDVLRWGLRLVWMAVMALSGAVLGGISQAWFQR